MLLSLLLHGDAVAGGGLFGYDAPRLHAVINDFPPALLVVGVLLELAYLFTKRESLRNAAYWTLVVGAVTTAVALFSGLRAEEAVEHGQAIHEIMQVHERFAWITLGVFGVVAVWRVLRESKMLRRERVVLALVGVVGLVLLTATGMEGGELVFDHAAGMSTEAMEAEIRTARAGTSTRRVRNMTTDAMTADCSGAEPTGRACETGHTPMRPAHRNTKTDEASGAGQRPTAPAPPRPAIHARCVAANRTQLVLRSARYRARQKPSSTSTWPRPPRYWLNS